MNAPFEDVVARHGAAILRVTNAHLNTHDAEDAWSETFLAALRAYPDLPENANVEAWLVTIARRKSIDIIRASQRHAIPVADVPDQESKIGLPEVPDLDLAHALNLLPPKQRTAVTYHFIAGLPYADVAAILGGTAEAARRAASDGLRTIRGIYPHT